MKKTLISLALTFSSTLGLAASDFNVNDYNEPDSRQINDRNGLYYDKNLLEVPVTDTRGSRTNPAAISSTTRMTRNDIEKSGARSVDQLLQQFAGINFSRNGGQGGLTSFYLRGAETDTTLVLVNNVRIQSLNTGYSAISDLPVSSIERIEVIRGAQSSLYGSAAPGGIIKIFTIPEKNRSTLSLSNGVSDQGGLQSALGGTGSFGDFLLFGNGNWSSVEGTNSCASTATCFLAAPEEDLDGVEQLNGQVGFQLFDDSGTSLQVSQLYNKARNEFDGDFTNESESTQKVTNAQLSQPIGQHQNLRFDLGQFNEFYQSFLDSDGTQSLASSYGTDRYTSSLVHEVIIPLESQDTVLTFISGLDYDHATIVEATYFPKINRQSSGAFSELELALNGTTMRLGARRDKYDEEHTELGSTKTNYATTGHLKLMFDITDRVALKTGLGRNFNMPTFSELYFPNFGNAELGPEIHVSQDIGLEYTGDIYNASLFFFRTKSKDLIVFDSVAFIPRSIGEALIRGVEFSQTLNKDNLQLGANMTYLNAINTSTGSAETELPRRPKLQFSGHLSYQMHRTLARLGIISSGQRYDDLANAVEVGGYTLFDLGLTHQATKHLSLGLRVDNLFDKEYQTVFGYNQPDRSVWIDLEYAIR